MCNTSVHSVFEKLKRNDEVLEVLYLCVDIFSLL